MLVLGANLGGWIQGKQRPARSWGLLVAWPPLERVFEGPGAVLQLLSLLQGSSGNSLGCEGQRTACHVVGCHPAS